MYITLKFTVNSLSLAAKGIASNPGIKLNSLPLVAGKRLTKLVSVLDDAEKLPDAVMIAHDWLFYAAGDKCPSL